LFGVLAEEGHGHVVTAILLAMVAMLLTATSYGRMARVYPSAGSAYTYVAAEFGPGAGYIIGWVSLLDYLLNPLICTIWCASAAANFAPAIGVHVWSIFFALLFTMLNLRGVETSARVNRWLAAFLGSVVSWMLFSMLRYVLQTGPHSQGFLTKPFYDPVTFSWKAVWTGTSVAALTYIGFDSISTLSEESINPQRDILRATVLTCLLTGVLAAAEVYVAQLIWPSSDRFPDVNTAYVFVAGRAGGRILFYLINATLLIATVGSGVGTQLSAARLLYGMGRDNALPRGFFGVIDPKRFIPRNNVVFIGALALGWLALHQLPAGRGVTQLRRTPGLYGGKRRHHHARSCKSQKPSLELLPAADDRVLVCLYIWLNLRRTARVTGLV